MGVWGRERVCVASGWGAVGGNSLGSKKKFPSKYPYATRRHHLWHPSGKWLLGCLFQENTSLFVCVCLGGLCETVQTCDRSRKGVFGLTVFFLMSPTLCPMS